VAAFLLLRGQIFDTRLSRDPAVPGTHKIHEEAVPRIGGVSIFLGWLAGLFAARYAGYLDWFTALAWAACLFPVFAAGLAEDFTKRVGVRTRFLMSLVSAAIAYFLLGVAATRIDIPGSDVLLAIPLISFVFTVLAIGGLAHAINIIDGLHGLALTIAIMAFIAIGYVAFAVGDSELLLLAGLGAGSTLGLRMWNYPSGQIFCGDGGAYFLGCSLAVLSGLLVLRHDEVSAWFPVLTLLYPIWETLFSAYRRKVIAGVPVSTPDQLHLHTLTYANMVRSSDAPHPQARSRRNSDASHMMILLALMNVVPAVLWWNETWLLVVSALFFIVVYLIVYRRAAMQAATEQLPGDMQVRIRAGRGLS
jgi:UDP-N-acetylmuramyl pentapeptide phosphotransferase/UDP-N-acetylglucosamine-1-phosphate transferase